MACSAFSSIWTYRVTRVNGLANWIAAIVKFENCWTSRFARSAFDSRVWTAVVSRAKLMGRAAGILGGAWASRLLGEAWSELSGLLLLSFGRSLSSSLTINFRKSLFTIVAITFFRKLTALLAQNVYFQVEIIFIFEQVCHLNFTCIISFFGAVCALEAGSEAARF